VPEGRIISCYLFDLDGTLFDTREANSMAYRKAFASEGVDIGDGYRDCQGFDFSQLVDRLAPHLSDSAQARVRGVKAEKYKESLDAIRPNLPLIDFACSLSADNMLGLVTSASRVNALAVLKHFGLESLFDATVFGEDVRCPKPSPEPYLLGLKRLGATPGHTVAFEDSEGGIRSARAAGLNVIKVRCP